MHTEKEGAEFVGARLPHNLRKLLGDAVARDNHLNISDWVRDAIREKLRREGFLKHGDPDA